MCRSTKTGRLPNPKNTLKQLKSVTKKTSHAIKMKPKKHFTKYTFYIYMLTNILDIVESNRFLYTIIYY